MLLLDEHILDLGFAIKQHVGSKSYISGIMVSSYLFNPFSRSLALDTAVNISWTPPKFASSIRLFPPSF